MLPTVDRDEPPAFKHDQEDIELGVRVCHQLMTWRPHQEGRVQVTAGHSPERPRPELVRLVRGKLSAADLSSAAAWVEDWKRDYGVDDTYLEALG